VAPVPTSRLREAPGPCRAALGAPRVPTALIPTSQLRAAPGLTCVPWPPAPTSQRREALGAPRVPVFPGQMKTVALSSSENRASDQSSFFSAPASRCRAAPGAPHVPSALVPTSPLRASVRPRRAAPGAPCVPAAPVPTSSNPICGGPAGVGRKAVTAHLATRGAGGGAYRR
jgi:hypothetical protein